MGYSLLAEQLVDERVDKTPLSDLSQLIDEIEQLVAQTTGGKESRAHEFISVSPLSLPLDPSIDVCSRLSAEFSIRS